MKVAVLTLGCRTNQAESIRIEGALEAKGHEVVSLADKPDLCIINTCSVTSRADADSRNLIHRACKGSVKTVVTGCYAELQFQALRKMDHDITIVRNSEKHNLFRMFDGNPSQSASCSPRRRSRAVVKVQDGCNNSCSYCVVPLARGRSQSMPVEEIKREVQAYETAGYHEIVLSGIHLGSYGHDLTPRVPLATLIRELLSKTARMRFRLSSIEVKEMDEELLDLLSDSRLCKHLHIPLQSGDDAVLRLMNRPYNVGDYVSKVEAILRMMPDTGLGTDVIVGFPGEGEAEFERTRSLIASLPFSYLHVFPYSPRQGTRAAHLPHAVPEREKRSRARALRQVGVRKRQEYLEKNVGKHLDVVVERVSPQGFLGTAGNYIKVRLGFQDGLGVGMLARVEISGCENGVAVGVPLRTREPSL